VREKERERERERVRDVVVVVGWSLFTPLLWSTALDANVTAVDRKGTPHILDTKEIHYRTSMMKLITE
jgi:hypothetical protein